jgi:hypothetical protein
MKPAFNPARLLSVFRTVFRREESDLPDGWAIKMVHRCELERRGVDSVRALLIGISDGRSGIGRDCAILLGGGIPPISRGDIEDWLKEKADTDARWIKVGTVAAIVAAVLAFLAWVYPLT